MYYTTNMGVACRFNSSYVTNLNACFAGFNMFCNEIHIRQASKVSAVKEINIFNKSMNRNKKKPDLTPKQ